MKNPSKKHENLVNTTVLVILVTLFCTAYYTFLTVAREILKVFVG